MAGAGHRGEVFSVWGRRWVLRERLGAMDLARCLANSHEDGAQSRKIHTQTSLEIEFRLWAQRSPKCFRRHLRNPRSSTCSVERGFADFAGMSSRHTRGLAEFHHCSLHLGAWVVALLWFCFCAFAVVVVVVAAAAVHGLSIYALCYQHVVLYFPDLGFGVADQDLLLGFGYSQPTHPFGFYGLLTRKCSCKGLGFANRYCFSSVWAFSVLGFANLFENWPCPCFVFFQNSGYAFWHATRSFLLAFGVCQVGVWGLRFVFRNHA